MKYYITDVIAKAKEKLRIDDEKLLFKTTSAYDQLFEIFKDLDYIDIRDYDDRYDFFFHYNLEETMQHMYQFDLFRDLVELVKCDGLFLLTPINVIAAHDRYIIGDVSRLVEEYCKVFKSDNWEDEYYKMYNSRPYSLKYSFLDYNFDLDIKKSSFVSQKEMEIFKGIETVCYYVGQIEDRNSCLGVHPDSSHMGIIDMFSTAYSFFALHKLLDSNYKWIMKWLERICSNLEYEYEKLQLAGIDNYKDLLKYFLNNYHNNEYKEEKREIK